MRRARALGQGTLFFDGDCGMCTRSAQLLARMNRTGEVRLEPLQAPGVLERVGAQDHDDLLASIWWLGDDGFVCRSAEAANAAAATALGTRLPLAVYRVPGVGLLQETVYRWVASHRRFFPGTTPHCSIDPAGCGRRPA